AEKDLGLAKQASDRFREAARLVDPKRNPAEYGSAHNALGLAEVDLGRPEAAIAAYEAALESFDASRYPRQRAATLHNLGLAHAAIGTGEHVGLAIERYGAALDLVTPADAPYIFAATHLSLANSLLSLPAEDRPPRLPEVIASIATCLQVFTRAMYPFQHAVAKNNLAVALEELAPDDPLTLRRALMHSEDAIAIFDPRLHSAQWKETRVNLARIEGRLANLGLEGDRTTHLVSLVAGLTRSEQLEIIRYRIGAYLAMPEPHRTASLEAFDKAVTSLEPIAVSSITQSWIRVLMEYPDADLQDALRIRHQVNSELQGEARATAMASMEAALGELEIIQRMRVRDVLTALGHERPDGS
ncbi:MAG: hypothetical protein HKN91_14045, partial [Acidimicrobiia bacterium]|nr:hypothetical protein [Acidimicrobiia bacterium]